MVKLWHELMLTAYRASSFTPHSTLQLLQTMHSLYKALIGNVDIL